VETSHQPWAAEPWQCVNYVSCHDNFTLFDKLLQSCPDADDVKLRKMQKLAGAIVLTSQGIPFLHAGSEFCRSKGGDHNSYRSPDAINQIDWGLKHRFYDVFEYYQKLVSLRKQVAAFRIRTADDIRRHVSFSPRYQPGVLAYFIQDYPNEKNWKTIQVIFNAKEDTVKLELDGAGWKLIARGDDIRLEGIEPVTLREVVVPAVSMMILVRD
jgi:pullulanase